MQLFLLLTSSLLFYSWPKHLPAVFQPWAAPVRQTGFLSLLAGGLLSLLAAVFYGLEYGWAMGLLAWSFAWMCILSLTATLIPLIAYLVNQKNDMPGSTEPDTC